MAAVSWPLTLPSVVDAPGYAERPPSAVIRTQMDAGRAKLRRRFTGMPREIPVQMTMTADQVAIFDDFFVNTLAQGVTEFDWVNPRTQDACEMRIFGGDDRPTYAPSSVGGDVWKVSFKVEII